MPTKDGSRIKSGMTKRKEPRWVIPFLRALERTGEARSAAKDAGIDFTTAYARRRAHAEFAGRWAEALRAHGARVKAEEEAEIAALKEGPPSRLSRATSPANAGEDEVVTGGQVRRVGNGRWSKAKEAVFFDELAATANATMAAEAAGVSPNAVFARRLRHPLFAAKWDAVVRTAKASIDLYLVEETRKSFDTSELGTAEVKPRVTIDQAIKISQLNASKPQKEIPAPFAEQAASMSGEELDAARERLVKKLMRFRDRMRAEKLELGWTLDEEHDAVIPPGWVRSPAK